MLRFSKNHDKIDQWLEEHTEDTPYRRRIIRMHTLYPEASLAQLRGHPGRCKRPLYWMKPRAVPREVLIEVVRIAEQYAVAAGCFEIDKDGKRILWRRPQDEPEE